MSYEEGVGKVAIIPMVTAPISTIASTAILIMILRSDKGLKKLYHRIMFGLSISDIIHSIALSFGTIPMPRGTMHAWKALGNAGTCEAQGFFFTIGGIASPMYSSVLCVYYYLSIKHQMSEEDISKRFEKYFHMVPIGMALGAAIPAVATQTNNPGIAWCGLHSLPINCHLRQDLIDSGQCHGKNVKAMFWLLNLAPIIAAALVICYTMISIYRAVKKQEDRVAEYNFPSGTTQRVSRTQKVWSRAIAYVIVLIISYVPLLVAVFVDRYSDIKISTLFAISYLFYPMQGLYNLRVFVMTSVAKHQEEKGLSYLQAFILTCKTFGRRETER